MKLIRFGKAGKEKPGIMVNDKLYDVSNHFSDFNEAFFSGDGLQRLADIAASHQGLQEISMSTRLGPPVARPSKMVCVGLNYRDHAAEMEIPLPTEPIIFFKATTAICGPYDNLIIPKNSTKTDWEVELAFVISKKASYVDEKDAMNYVAGYCLHNDYSERAFQLERGGQWAKGKGCDSFAPLGPFLATPDEIEDVHNLTMWLEVNGKIFQQSSTSNQIFKVPFLVHYISQFMTLLPGDIISTGSPHGVGQGIKPEPVFIKPGDLIELGIEGLGTSRQRAVAYNAVE